MIEYCTRSFTDLVTSIHHQARQITCFTCSIRGRCDSVEYPDEIPYLRENPQRYVMVHTEIHCLRALSENEQEAFNTHWYCTLQMRTESSYVYRARTTLRTHVNSTVPNKRTKGIMSVSTVTDDVDSSVNRSSVRKTPPSQDLSISSSLIAD
eukprot:scaffold10997_cov216-Amphora_coffeaeformis.AAC.2